MIPHYKDRPLSMNPHPDGIHGKSYWVKDKPDYAPDWIPTFRYQDQKSLKDWILIEEVATRIWHFDGERIEDFKGAYEDYLTTCA